MRSDSVLYIAAGVLAGGVIAWSAMRVESKPVPTEAAVTTTSPLPPTQSLDSVPRISIPDYMQRVDRGEFVVIDVRDSDDYIAAHIPDAIHIPLSFIQGELPYLPRGKPIVTYCT